MNSISRSSILFTDIVTEGLNVRKTSKNLNKYIGITLGDSGLGALRFSNKKKTYVLSDLVGFVLWVVI